MKAKNAKKLFLTYLIGFSLFSFVFVNSHAYFSFDSQMPQPVSIEKSDAIENDDQTKELKLPDTQVLQKLLKLIDRFAI